VTVITSEQPAIIFDKKSVYRQVTERCGRMVVKTKTKQNKTKKGIAGI
jgi:hypothetical protein